MRSPFSALLVAALIGATKAASLGEYIRVGLGITKTETSTSTITAYRTNYANSTSNATDTASLLQCAASWASYDAFTSTDVSYITTTAIQYTTSSGNVTSGTGDVYTTSDGIPVASGSFTPTKVIETVLNITTTTGTFYRTTFNAQQYNATPSCSSISPSECSVLYVSYIASLGLAANASVPSITPAPSNSPACPEYYYKTMSGCSYWRDTGTDLSTCYISGANVQLFYFPSASANASVASANSTTQLVVQSYAPGITFTSPSIYLSFDYLSALSGVAAMESACSSCGWDGCSGYAVGGGDGLDYKGTSVAGALLTLAPEEVSSLVVSYPDAQASSVADVIAKGLPGFANSVMNVLYGDNLMAKPLQLNALTHPAPTDYYLKAHGAPGCNSSWPTPECSTIFDGEYRAILSLPSQVSLLQGAWSSCVPAIYGVYDPPKALTEVTTIAGVSRYTHSTSSSAQQPTTSSYQAVPVDGPASPTPRPTSATTAPFTTDTPTSNPAASGAPGHDTATSYVSTTVPLSAPYASGDPSDDSTVGRPSSNAPGSDPVASSDPPNEPANTIASSGAPAFDPDTSDSPANDPFFPSQPTTTTNALSVLESAVESATSETHSNGLVDPVSADPNSSAAPTTIVTVNGYDFTAYRTGNDVVINGVTMTSDDGLQRTMDGQRVSVGSDSIVIGSSTVPLPLTDDSDAESNPVSAVVITAPSTTITAVQDPTAGSVQVIDGSISLTAGAPAETINGVTVSATEGGIVQDGSFIPATAVPTASNSDAEGSIVSAAVITAPSAVITVVQDPTASSVQVIDGSITLTAGGPAKTIDGVALSATEGGIVQDGSFVPVTAVSTVVGNSESTIDASGSRSDAGHSSSTATAAIATSSAIRSCTGHLWQSLMLLLAIILAPT